MCTFVHSYQVFVSTDKDNEKGWIPGEEFSLIYFCKASEELKVLAGTNRKECHGESIVNLINKNNGKENMGTV